MKTAWKSDALYGRYKPPETVIFLAGQTHRQPLCGMRYVPYRTPTDGSKCFVLIFIEWAYASVNTVWKLDALYGRYKPPKTVIFCRTYSETALRRHVPRAKLNLHRRFKCFALTFIEWTYAPVTTEWKWDALYGRYRRVFFQNDTSQYSSIFRKCEKRFKKCLTIRFGSYLEGRFLCH